MLQEIDSDEDVRGHYLAIRTKFRITAAVALVVLVVGAGFYHYVEDLRWIDAFYFCTITLTTIGYGDITPMTDAGKLFTIFYVLMGVGIIATLANLFLQNAFGRRQIKKTAKQRNVDTNTDRN